MGVGLSLLLHGLLALDWGFDSGRRPAQSPAVITARLEPVSAPSHAAVPVAEPPGEAALLDVDVPAPLALARQEPLPALPGREETPPPAELPTPPVRLPDVSKPEPSAALPAADDPGEPGPVLSVPVVPERQGTAAPRAGEQLSGAADLTWYTGRDLDVLPRPLAPIEPQFPLNAQLRGVSGKVTLAVSIDAAGRVVDIEVVRADPAGFFEASALDAFRAARYAPGVKDGRAVRARLQTVVVFELSAP